jgi:outer membrane protein insertion porin family
VAFYDAGNVFLEASDFNPFDLRHAAGLGLWVDLPVGLVRVDWAHLLDPQPGERLSRFYFSFGHAF